MPTTQQQLIEERLGSRLTDYLTDQRQRGLSWRYIAADLYERTGVSVSYETVRTWATQEAQPEEAGTVE